ncbi:FAD:protein FMN transferase (plasmid) [Cupriavidus neocaledonicus]|uniref:FAD:protein FMN transferase n=1 Tax=Cupriavidus neocaledonicus TaxID=1040979 RepID=A0A375HLH7_9BURK|nr:FAD:protein FMN transferase [Cupriavidus neocaledonicus]SPD58692.1 FAD:protein FMN transferase [Cupriavidus neocaledonicus]
MNRVLVPVALRAPPSPPPAGARLQRWGGPAMGASWSVAALLPPDADAGATGAIGAGIHAVLERVIAQMSNWEADSDLSRFNRAPAGSWHALPADCFAVLQTALQVARDSGGAYDPSAGPLVDLWGFGPAPARHAPPSPEQVRAMRGRCGWARIEVDAAGRRARQPGGVALDFCAIAKGFAVDAVAHYLCEQGLDHHLTEIGGELRGHGVKPDGMPWWVALEAPPGPASDAAQQTLVALHGLSVATSGDYRRYFDSDGRRYAHTIDPRTGYPASHALASVTVLHAQCMLADALSTALTVLGPDAGMAHARRHGIAARFLVRTADGFLEHLSPAFAAMLA